MKKLLTVGLLIARSVSGSPDIRPASLADRVRSADVIAVVSVSGVTASTHTNAAGVRITVFVGDAAVERTLKGRLPEKVRLKNEAAASVFSQWHLGTSRFLVFLKRSGDFYAPADSYGLAPVFGSGLPNDCRVLWPDCTTLEEAETAIQRVVKK